MDQAHMLSIVGGLYDKLVADVSDAVLSKLKAEGAAQFTLETELLGEAIAYTLNNNTTARDAVRDIVDDKIGNLDLNDYREFSSLDDRVTELESNDGAKIDADDEDFADAVRSVIRNNI